MVMTRVVERSFGAARQAAARTRQDLLVGENVLIRAEQRRHRALSLVDELGLRERWAPVGRVELVGAVAHGLVVSHDIDFEVFTRGEPNVADGFAVLSSLAEHPRVRKAQFTNALRTADQGLYWQIRCVDADSIEWKVDLWTLAEDHPGPCAAWIVEPMQRALTDASRRAILTLKEARAAGQTIPVASIDLYRAVLDGGVQTPEELSAFLGPDYTPSLTPWTPTPA